MIFFLRHLLVFIAVAAGLTNASVKKTVCNGQSYVYQELAGYGYMPSDARDRYGDSMSFDSFDKPVNNIIRPTTLGQQSIINNDTIREGKAWDPPCWAQPVTRWS